MDGEYPNGWTPRYAAYSVTEVRCRGGTVRVHEPRRSAAEEAVFRDGLRNVIESVCPGWTLRSKSAVPGETSVGNNTNREAVPSVSQYEHSNAVRCPCR